MLNKYNTIRTVLTVLRPLLLARQAANNPDLLLLDDITPSYDVTHPTGYGNPNPNRTQVEYVRILLVTPTNQQWATNPLRWQPGGPSLEVLASDFTLVTQEDPTVTTSCEKDDCYNLSTLKFIDGEYSLTYEVYAKVGIPTERGNYHLDIPTCLDEKVYVTKNGAWLDITSQGTRQPNGRFQWSKLDTADVYEKYQRRKILTIGGYTVVETGSADTVMAPSATAPLGTSTEPKVAGAYTLRLLLTGVARASIGRLALKLTSRCNKPLELYTQLAVAQMQLNTIAETACDADCFGHTLLDVQQVITYITNRL